MKKTILFLLFFSFYFESISQIDAKYCNYGDKNDFLLVMLSLFPDGSYQLEITDMAIEDQPVYLFISMGCYIEDKNGRYVLTDSYNNEIYVIKEGPIPAVNFGKNAPIYLQSKRLFFLGKTGLFTKENTFYATWSYFSRKEMHEYLKNNRTKYRISNGTYLSVSDIDFSLTIQNKEYILQAECFPHTSLTLSRGRIRHYKNILILKDENGCVFYVIVSKDGILLKYNNGYELLKRYNVPQN